MATHRINKGLIYKVATKRPYLGSLILIYDVCNALCTQKQRIEKELKNAFKQSFNTLMYYLNIKPPHPQNKKKKQQYVSVNYMEVGNEF